jgi:hypothetical protein
MSTSLRPFVISQYVLPGDRLGGLSAVRFVSVWVTVSFGPSPLPSLGSSQSPCCVIAGGPASSSASTDLSITPPLRLLARRPSGATNTKGGVGTHWDTGPVRSDSATLFAGKPSVVNPEVLRFESPTSPRRPRRPPVALRVPSGKAIRHRPNDPFLSE